jgi:predicted dehydrogenase
MPERLNVGLVGLGYIGKIHATAYKNIPLCFSEPPVTANLQAVLRSQLKTELALMDELGIELRTTDPQAFYAAPLDVVDICTPNVLHLDQATAAIQHNLPVYCEKPLAMDLAEARRMAAMAREAGVLTHVAFVLRYVPAVQQMKALLEADAIGEVLNFRAIMFHSSYLDPQRPMSWRLRDSDSGGGAFADLGAHLIDLTHYLLGSVQSVSAWMRTVIKERPKAKGSEERERVDVDDWAHCRLILEDGIPGHLEATRMAAGASEATVFEVYGRKGSLHFRIAEPSHVNFYDLETGRWNVGAIDAPEPSGERPLKELWPSGKYSQGLMTDAHLASAYDFLQCIVEGKPSNLGFDAGLAVQEVLEASYRSADRGGEQIDLPLEA